MSDDERTRTAGEWTICGAINCDAPASVDVMHHTIDGQRTWVPLCAAHVANPCGLEYLLETHGFFSGEREDVT